MLPVQVMTALAVAKETLQRREAASPRALALAAERQGKAMFVVPEVIYLLYRLVQKSACCCGAAAWCLNCVWLQCAQMAEFCCPFDR